MGNKLRHEIEIQITRNLMKITSGTFDEDTVRSLYGHLRQHAAKDGYTRDIGDFFAHPDRNKGKLRKHVQETVRFLRECEHLANSGQSLEGKVPKVDAIPYWVIMNDLNAELKKLGQLPLEAIAFHAVGLVLMSAMQGSAISFPDGETLTLHLASFADQAIELYGHRPVSVPVPSGIVSTMFPVIGMPNMFKIPNFLMRPDDPKRPILRVTFEGWNAVFVQELAAFRADFVPGSVFHGGHITVAEGIPMVQPLAVKPPEKPAT